MRVGIGYDVHQLAAGKSLILCGVEIDYPLGLLGYSDADVGLHALCDAILGAGALGDLGKHFPTGDPRWEGVASSFILTETVRIAREAGLVVGNCDITIVAQAPKIAASIPRMRERIAALIGIDVGLVSVKATTTDHLGSIGRKEGMAAMAVVMLLPTPD